MPDGHVPPSPRPMHGRATGVRHRASLLIVWNGAISSGGGSGCKSGSTTWPDLSALCPLALMEALGRLVTCAVAFLFAGHVAGIRTTDRHVHLDDAALSQAAGCAPEW